MANPFCERRMKYLLHSTHSLLTYLIFSILISYLFGCQGNSERVYFRNNSHLTFFVSFAACGNKLREAGHGGPAHAAGSGERFGGSENRLSEVLDNIAARDFLLGVKVSSGLTIPSRTGFDCASVMTNSFHERKMEHLLHSTNISLTY
jgi:hypothetical protein